MTLDKFDKFRKDFLAFLNESTVNLGRRTAKTRQTFIDKAIGRVDSLRDNFIIAEICPEEEPKVSPKPTSGSIICMKPTQKSKALNAGKGVHAMTQSKSMQADEELNRSPYGKGAKNDCQ